MGIQRIVAIAVVAEKSIFQRGASLPVDFHAVDVGGRKTAVQMRLDVLLYLAVHRLYVARDVQVEVVPFYLVPFHHAAIVDNGLLTLPGIHDTLDVLFTQAVLRSVLGKTILGIDVENALADVLVLLVDDDDGRRDACAKEDIWRQTDDALNVVLFHDVLADVVLGISTKQHAMGQNAGTTPHIGSHGADEVQQKGIVATFGRRQQFGSPAVVLVGNHVGCEPVFL